MMAFLAGCAAGVLLTVVSALGYAAYLTLHHPPADR